MAKRLTSLLLALLFLVLLPGCGNKGDTIFRLDLSESVASLDPQFATRSSDRVVIANLFEGLMTQDASGALSPGAASGYTVSGDGRTYTFTIRPGAQWSDGTPLTAADFQFALRRLFDPESPSPYAEELACIAGSREVLAGSLPLDQLGVKVQGEQLVIQLESPEPDLPALLCASYAMPCNEAFFTAQKGRYGVSLKAVLGNGPFVLTVWDNSKSVNLRRNEAYVGADPALAAGVNLYIQREGDPVARLLAGETDAAQVPYDRLAELQDSKCTWQGAEDTTWALLFNVRAGDYSQRSIRQALAAAIDREAFAQSLTGDARHTTELVPPAVKILDRSYRELAGSAAAVFQGDVRGLLSTGLDGLGQTKLNKTDLLVPDGRMERTAAGSLQRSWQDGLNAYINILPLEQGELERRVAAGDFQIALVPLRGSAEGVSGLLGRFATNARENWSGYANPDYDTLLGAADRTASSEGVARQLAQAERLLLTDAVVVPLYNTATYTAQAQRVQGIQYGGLVGEWYFKYATNS